MRPLSGALWRVFPWNPSAAAGEPFSSTYQQRGQTSGRFDLNDRPPVLYLAESRQHAVGEKLQRFRGRRLTPGHLAEYGHPLALVPVIPALQVVKAVADLTDPTVLQGLRLRPDAIASRNRQRTQAIARRLYEERYSGLHWWSALTGDWHTTVLFLDPKRVPTGELTIGEPERLSIEHRSVLDCLEALGIERP